MDSLRDAMEQQSQARDESSVSVTQVHCWKRLRCPGLQEAGMDLASEMAAEARVAETQTLLEEVTTLNKSVREQEDRQEVMLQQMTRSLGEEMAKMKEQMGSSTSTNLEELKELLTSRNEDDSNKQRIIELERVISKGEAATQLAQQEAERNAAIVQRLTAELDAQQPKLTSTEQQVSCLTNKGKPSATGERSPLCCRCVH